MTPSAVRHPLLAVIGESVISHPDHAALAEEVGRRIAEAGYGLICGGLGGVMEAACRGARGAGGLTVGVLPGEETAAANPFVVLAIPTGMGQMRNVIIVLAAQAVIAIGGGAGTLSEIGHALRLGRRVVGLRTWQASVAGRPAEIVEAATAEEAVRLALVAGGRA
ncbi:MAG: TIGR00725 family protein [Armatimonadota bacterium]|nr:TIGR00725 family protein [Armatimonadota bacterium]